jgi:hypothetical protein
MSENFCYRCHEAIEIANLVTLEPCGHHVCVFCLVELEAARGCKQLRCQCNGHVNSHRWQREVKPEQQKKRTRSGSVFRSETPNEVEEVSVMHPFDLHKDVDAFRLWFTSLARNTKSDNEDIIGSGLVVNQMYTVSLEKKGRFVIKRLEFIISANAQFLPSTEAETAIVDTFCWLHSAVIPLSLTPEFNEDIHDSESHQMPPVRKPTNLLEFAIHQERRFLPRCMLALATGKRSFNDIDKINPDHQGQVFSAMLATDLIVRALDSRKSIGVAVSLLSYQLENASQTQFNVENYRTPTPRPRSPQADETEACTLTPRASPAQRRQRSMEGWPWPVHPLLCLSAPQPTHQRSSLRESSTKTIGLGAIRRR